MFIEILISFYASKDIMQKIISMGGVICRKLSAEMSHCNYKRLMLVCNLTSALYHIKDDGKNASKGNTQNQLHCALHCAAPSLKSVCR
jgi:hypothetical protein